MSRRGSLAWPASISARLSPDSRARASKSVSQRSRSRASRRTWNIIWFRGRCLPQRSTLPIGRSLEHPGIHLQEHDHAALRPEVADVVRHAVRERHDRSRRHHDLATVDGHVRRALQHEDRLFLLGMAVHDRGLAGLVAGDLRPELVGLEEHLAHALVGGEGFQCVQVEHLRDAPLTVRAEIQSAVNRALEGESLLAVQVEPASSFHPGRVVLSTPMGYEWLVHEAWNPVIEHAPKEYEVVLRHAA